MPTPRAAALALSDQQRPDLRRLLRAQSTPQAPAPRAPRRPFPPPRRLHVVELATLEDPAAAGCPAGSWSLGDLAFTICREAHDRDLLRARLAAAAGAAAAQLAPPALDLWPMSRST